MSDTPQNPPPPLQWRLECLAHSWIEWLAGLLPGPWAFRLGEALGGLGWHFMPLRRKIILRNLRIAFAGEKTLPELQRMARETFRRTGANMISAAHTARLSPEQLGQVIHIENLDLLEHSLTEGKGVVLLLAHMGNWEILSRIIHLFPKGSKTGAFYRPLNNRLLDERVLARRQADGTRMFSKRDPFHQVTGFLRDGGIVGVLADQRVGMQGEVVSFFGRQTRASPLPSLLARRAKSEVLTLALVTERPGKWKAVFIPVAKPPSTVSCMISLEQAMKANPMDVFWFQERWKVYLKRHHKLHDSLGSDHAGNKRHRALLWLEGVPPAWRIPEEWVHPDVVYEAASAGPSPPPWLPETTAFHKVATALDRAAVRETIDTIDAAAILPLDFILTTAAPEALVKAARHLGIPLVSLP